MYPAHDPDETAYCESIRINRHALREITARFFSPLKLAIGESSKHKTKSSEGGKGRDKIIVISVYLLFTIKEAFK